MLASLSVLDFSGAKSVDGKQFPLVVGPHAGSPGAAALAATLEENKDEALELCLRHGAVLFRGFETQKAEDFATVVKSLHLEKYSNTSAQGPRTRVVDDVVFAVDSSKPSHFHHELDQVPAPPKYVLLQSSHDSGDVSLVLSSRVYDFFSSHFATTCAKVEEEGVRYVVTLPADDDAASSVGPSWRTVLEVSTRTEAENKLRSGGSEWQWNSDASLRVLSPIVPAVTCDFRTRQRVFFNSLVTAVLGWNDARNDGAKAVLFADGTPMDVEAVRAVAEFMKQDAVTISWKQGDILLIDNTVVQHALSANTHPVLISLTGPLALPSSLSPSSPIGCSPSLTLRSGDKLPLVGFGFWKVPRDVTPSIVVEAIRAGYRHLDCACDYGNEKEVGEGIRQAISLGLCQRKDLWVTSKLWNTYHARNHVGLALRRTLEDLGLDYLDLYLIHFPISLRFVPFETRYPPEWVFDPTSESPRLEEARVPVKETWRAMEDLVTLGLVRNIGLGNWSVQGLRDIISYAKILPAVNQVEIHPYNSQEKLVRFCHAHGIAITAFSPLGNASYVELGARKEDSAMKEPVVQALSTKYNKSPAQILLRWGVQRNMSVIPKTSQPSRVPENINLFDFSLTDEEMASVSSLNKNLRFNDPGVFTASMGAFVPIYE